MNVFVIKGIARDVPLETIFRGVTPFIVAQIVLIALLIAFPQTGFVAALDDGALSNCRRDWISRRRIVTVSPIRDARREKLSERATSVDYLFVENVPGTEWAMRIPPAAADRE